MNEPVTPEAVAHVLDLARRMLTDLTTQNDPDVLARHRTLLASEEELCFLLEAHLASVPLRARAT